MELYAFLLYKEIFYFVLTLHGFSDYILGTNKYAEFTYPIIPCAAVFTIMIVICLITSKIMHKSNSKATLAERLREAE